MLSTNQLAEMQRAMEEEHRQDREALERLKRFLPASSNGNGHKAAAMPGATLNNEQESAFLPSDAGLDIEVDAQPDTLIGRVRQLLKNDPNKGWTVPSVIEHLTSAGYKFAAKTPESSLGLTFSKLVKRKEARITKKGSGRIPHVYKAAKEKEETPESN